MKGGIEEKLEPTTSGTRAVSKFTLVEQILSGFHDPGQSKSFINKNVPYTAVEYENFGAAIYAKVPPEVFFPQLIGAYQNLKTDEERAIFIHNAQALIKQIIKADVNQEFKEKTKNGIEELKAVIKDPEFYENLNGAFIAADKRKSDLQSVVGASASSSKEMKADYLDNPSDLADDLKNHQLKVVSNLRLGNYHNKNFEKKDKAQQVAEFADDFNTVTAMVTTDILSASNKDEQKQRYQFYIKVLEQCLEKGDYISAQEIRAALQGPSVSRLKYLQSELSADQRASFENSDRILSPTKNYAALKEHMQNKKKDTTVVPPINLLNQAVTFIEDGNPNKTEYKNPNKKDKTPLQKDNEDKILMEGKELTNIVYVQNQVITMGDITQKTNFEARLSEEPKLSDNQRVKLWDQASLAIRKRGDDALLINENPTFTPNLRERLQDAAASVAPKTPEPAIKGVGELQTGATGAEPPPVKSADEVADPDVARINQVVKRAEEVLIEADAFMNGSRKNDSEDAFRGQIKKNFDALFDLERIIDDYKGKEIFKATTGNNSYDEKGILDLKERISAMHVAFIDELETKFFQQPAPTEPVVSGAHQAIDEEKVAPSQQKTKAPSTPPLARDSGEMAPIKMEPAPVVAKQVAPKEKTTTQKLQENKAEQFPIEVLLKGFKTIKVPLTAEAQQKYGNMSKAQLKSELKKLKVEENALQSQLKSEQQSQLKGKPQTAVKTDKKSPEPPRKGLGKLFGRSAVKDAVPNDPAAEALTLKERNIEVFSRITSEELLSVGWLDSATQDKCKNITIANRQAQELTERIQQDIIGPRDNPNKPEKQSRMFSYYVAVLDHAMKIGDFQTASTVNAALQDLSTNNVLKNRNDLNAKQKAFIKSLPKDSETQELFKKYEETFLPTKSAKNSVKEYMANRSEEGYVPMLVTMTRGIVGLEEKNKGALANAIKSTMELPINKDITDERKADLKRELNVQYRERLEGEVAQEFKKFKGPLDLVAGRIPQAAVTPPVTSSQTAKADDQPSAPTKPAADVETKQTKEQPPPVVATQTAEEHLASCVDEINRIKKEIIAVAKTGKVENLAEFKEKCVAAKAVLKQMLDTYDELSAGKQGGALAFDENRAQFLAPIRDVDKVIKYLGRGEIKEVEIEPQAPHDPNDKGKGPANEVQEPKATGSNNTPAHDPIRLPIELPDTPAKTFYNLVVTELKQVSLMASAYGKDHETSEAYDSILYEFKRRCSDFPPESIEDVEKALEYAVEQKSMSSSASKYVLSLIDPLREKVLSILEEQPIKEVKIEPQAPHNPKDKGKGPANEEQEPKATASNNTPPPQAHTQTTEPPSLIDAVYDELVNRGEIPKEAKEKEPPPIPPFDIKPAELSAPTQKPTAVAQDEQFARLQQQVEAKRNANEIARGLRNVYNNPPLTSVARNQSMARISFKIDPNFKVPAFSQALSAMGIKSKINENAVIIKQEDIPKLLEILNDKKLATQLRDTYDKQLKADDPTVIISPRPTFIAEVAKPTKPTKPTVASPTTAPPNPQQPISGPNSALAEQARRLEAAQEATRITGSQQGTRTTGVVDLSELVPTVRKPPILHQAQGRPIRTTEAGVTPPTAKSEAKTPTQPQTPQQVKPQQTGQVPGLVNLRTPVIPGYLLEVKKQEDAAPKGSVRSKIAQFEKNDSDQPTNRSPNKLNK